MCTKKATVQFVDRCTKAAGYPTTPAQQDFISCLLVATMAVLPEFILALTGCLTGGGGGGTGGFNPGDRDRCGT